MNEAFSLWLTHFGCYVGGYYVGKWAVRGHAALIRWGRTTRQDSIKQEYAYEDPIFKKRPSHVVTTARRALTTAEQNATLYGADFRDVRFGDLEKYDA